MLNITSTRTITVNGHAILPHELEEIHKVAMNTFSLDSSLYGVDAYTLSIEFYARSHHPLWEEGVLISELHQLAWEIYDIYND